MEGHGSSISGRLNSRDELGDFLLACLTVGDHDLLQECLAHTPEWVTFRDVQAAVEKAGLRFSVAACESRAAEPSVAGRFWRRASDRRVGGAISHREGDAVHTPRNGRLKP